jgi:hypothetical protein
VEDVFLGLGGFGRVGEVLDVVELHVCGHAGFVNGDGVLVGEGRNLL